MLPANAKARPENPGMDVGSECRVQGFSCLHVFMAFRTLGFGFSSLGLFGGLQSQKFWIEGANAVLLQTPSVSTALTSFEPKSLCTLYIYIVYYVGLEVPI